jgi:5-methylcytosine-specific restriction endonuclease McrA
MLLVSIRKLLKRCIMNLTPIPKILQLDMSGLPHSWITIEEAVNYYAKDMVIYELGSPVATYHGGVNRLTQEESRITANSIIGIKGSRVKSSEFRKPLNLTNHTLFERDRHLCAYCGDVLHTTDLSREHIVPVCQDGSNEWMNVVTACKACNGKKGGRTLEQSGMSLLYLPYVPDRYESFILTQGTRRILSDQMDFLLSKVPKNSRLKLN